MSTYRVGIDMAGRLRMQRLSTSTAGQSRSSKCPVRLRIRPVVLWLPLSAGWQRCDVGGEAVRLVVHATTVATNALIEGKTASLGMLTTQGFRDILEIGRQIRARLYDVHLTSTAIGAAALELWHTRTPRRRGAGAGAAGRRGSTPGSAAVKSRRHRSHDLLLSALLHQL